MEFLRHGRVVGCTLAVVAAGCEGSVSSTAGGVPAAEALAVGGSIRLAVSGRSNANVSLAAARMFVAAVWSASERGGSTDIFIAASQDGGATFSSPSRVNSQPGAASASGEQPPRVALVDRGQAARRKSRCSGPAEMQPEGGF
jgi:hypothetical protein